VVPALALKLGDRFWWPAKPKVSGGDPRPVEPKESVHAG
jgi:hypothetical protein